MVHVADTGVGIAKEDLTHVFERFYRVNNADWDKGAHAGLGLAITKSILDLHRSRLTVESKLGMGTVFHFTLPVAQREAADTPRGSLAEVLAGDRRKSARPTSPSTSAITDGSNVRGPCRHLDAWLALMPAVE